MLHTNCTTQTISLNRFLRMSDLVHVTGLSKATIYEKINQGLFPKQIKIGKTSVWLASDVDLWMRSLYED